MPVSGQIGAAIAKVVSQQQRQQCPSAATACSRTANARVGVSSPVVGLRFFKVKRGLAAGFVLRARLGMTV